MESVKRDMRKLCKQLSLDIKRRQEGHDILDSIRHMMFTGNPGTGKTAFAALYGQLLGDLGVVPSGRVVRVTGAQLQDEGVKGLEEILKEFDEPGEAALQVGDTVEVRREGKWGHFGKIVHVDTSRDARPPYKGTYDVHFGEMVKFQLSDGSTVTRRDHDFDIGVRRKDMRAPDETGGVLIMDDAHQLDPGSERAARQVRRRLEDEMEPGPWTPTP